jgi:predicted TIM-barrel fold metal-dependent hydrolase
MLFERFEVIDVDTHITEPPDTWLGRMPSKWGEAIPHIERIGGFDTWVINGQPYAKPGNTAMAGFDGTLPDGPATYEEMPKAAWDPHARVAFMDEQHIRAQVLYPNLGGFGAGAWLDKGDPAYALDCVRAYNDFQSDFSSVAPDRLLPITSIPFWDVDAAVAEIERGAEAGHCGVLFTAEPQRFGLPFLGEPHWDPFWAAAQAAGLPIHFHIGGGDAGSTFKPDRVAAHGNASTYSYVSTEMFLKNGLQVADLLTSGVLPRFPDLDFVSVESGIGWIPFVLEAVDHSYLEAREGRTSQWDLLPSEYFARQVYACTWFETVATTRLLGPIPVDNVMFETDFPHPTCLYGNVHERIEAAFAGVDDATRHKVLWGNAARLYGIEDAPEAWVAQR